MWQDIITLLQNILHFTLQVLSHPAWQGVAVIISIAGVSISLVSMRKPAPKIKHHLKGEVARKLKSVPSNVPVTHLPKSIPLLISGSLVSSRMNISAEKIYIKAKPLDKIVQLNGRGARVL